MDQEENEMREVALATQDIAAAHGMVTLKLSSFLHLLGKYLQSVNKN
jgi:hypothetical protein